MKKFNKIFLIFFLLTFIACGEKQPAGANHEVVNSDKNGKNKYDFSGVEKIVNDAIKDSAFPGAVVLVEKNGKIIFEKAFGHFTYDKNSPPVRTSTLFDLASVSKVIATTTAAMVCFDRKLFKLDDKVSKFIPEFSQNGKGDITIRNLLLHNSGLPAYKRFYKFCKNADDVLKDIYSTKLEYPTGSQTVYSDLGMILMGKIIEKVTGMTLDQFAKKEIFIPLGMKNTMYNPPDSLKKKCAPTEIDNYWRHKLIQGEVHDETAAMLGGVAGHAGLFSTAEDIAKVLQMLLQKGKFKGKQIVKAGTIRLFITKQSAGGGEESSRALGWDTKSPVGSSAGNLFSDKSYGHTGFTGTSVWTDPTRNLFVVFLTNRVYPTRENNKLLKVRPALHDAVINAIAKR